MSIIHTRSAAFAILLFLSSFALASQENGARARLRRIMGHIKPNTLALPSQGALKHNNVLGDRPAAVQEAVDRSFEQNKKIGDDHWLFNGNSYKQYRLLGFHDEAFLTNVSLANEDQKNVYILDVGCARGGWGYKAANFLLNHEPSIQSGKHFHVISVTGGQECTEGVWKAEHVTLHQFNQFKVENVDEELATRGFDLAGKVRLIVSNWTLRHLTDPFGTLKKMYSLLTPGHGMLAATGFLFALKNSNDVKMFPWGNTHMCSDPRMTGIFRLWRSQGNLDDFLLRRNDHQELDMPISYTGVVKKLNGRHDCASNEVTVFERDGYFQPNIHRFKDKKSEIHAFPSYDTYYWNKGSQESEQLYCALKTAHQGFVEQRRKDLGYPRAIIKEVDESE